MERSLYGMGLLFVTGVQQIPAGGNISSPCNEHDRNDAAHFVFSNGYVFGNWEVAVWDSYGNPFSFSPDLVYYSDYAYCIDKRGAVYDNDQYVAETSYGCIISPRRNQLSLSVEY